MGLGDLNAAEAIAAGFAAVNRGDANAAEELPCCSDLGDPATLRRFSTSSDA